jgi:hypothetical protein
LTCGTAEKRLAGWWTVGPAFIDELVGQELIGHAIRNDRGHSLLATFWQPTAYLLGRFLPWSVLLFWIVPRVVRRPAGAWVVAPEIETLTAAIEARNVETHVLLEGGGGYALVSNEPRVP